MMMVRLMSLSQYAPAPIFKQQWHLGITYVWVQHANLYLLAMTRSNANASSIVLFLHRLVDVFKEYFEELEEESLRDNFVIVYELLDEVNVHAGKPILH